MKTNKILLVALVFCLAVYKDAFAIGSVVDPGPKKLIIDITGYKRDVAADTLTLKLYDAYLSDVPLGSPRTFFARRDGKGRFHFNIPVNKPYGYFELTAKMSTKSLINRSTPIFTPQFWEAGDSLQIRTNPQEKAGGLYHNARFSGRGSEKYTARYVLQNISYLQNERDYDGDLSDPAYFTERSKNEKRRLDILSDFEQSMSPLSYDILKADLCFSRRWMAFYHVNNFFKKIDKGDNASLQRFRKAFHDTFDSGINLGISDKGLENSSEYLLFQYQRLRMGTYLEGFGKNLDLIFKAIVSTTNGLTREALLISFFTWERNTTKGAEYFSKASEIIKEPKFKSMLTDLKIVIPGWTMADYTFADINGKSVKLSDFDDKIVIIDTWSAGCTACVTFYKQALSRIEEKFEANKNVVVLSISTDTSIGRWKEGLKSDNFTGEKAVNIYSEGKGVNHPFFADHKLFATPSVILMDRGRKVMYFNTENLYKYDGLLAAVNQTLQSEAK